MPKKFYAVKHGRTPGIYTSWEECRLQVSGFSGASYKSFESLEEAKSFIFGATCIFTGCEATAYTDGSYDHSTRRFSYGVVIFWNNDKYTFSESFFDDELSLMRNVAGEIKGAERAFQFCLDNGIHSLELLYDYEGVEKWCTGKWQRNKSGTIAYHNYYTEISKYLDVKFSKVKGHSGNTYNDEADSLAKAALGIKSAADIE